MSGKIEYEQHISALLFLLNGMKKQIKEYGYIHPKSQTLEDFLRLNEKVYKLKLKTLKENF